MPYQQHHMKQSVTKKAVNAISNLFWERIFDKDPLQSIAEPHRWFAANWLDDDRGCGPPQLYEEETVIIASQILNE